MTPATPRQWATAVVTAAAADDVSTVRQLAQEAEPLDVEHLAILAAWAVDVLAGRLGLEAGVLLERLGRAAAPAAGEAGPDATVPSAGGTEDTVGGPLPSAGGLEEAGPS